MLPESPGVLELVGVAAALSGTCMLPLFAHNTDVQVVRIDDFKWRCWVRNLEDVPLCAQFRVEIRVEGPLSGSPKVRVRAPLGVAGRLEDRVWTCTRSVMDAGESWMIDVDCKDASGVEVRFGPQRAAKLTGRVWSALVIRRVVARCRGIGETHRRRTLPGPVPCWSIALSAVAAYWAPFAISLGPLSEYYVWGEAGLFDVLISAGILGAAALLYVACRRDVPPRVLDVLDVLED